MVISLKSYLRGFKKFYSDKNHRALLIIVVFAVSIITLIYNYSLKVSEKALSEQMLHREQIVARSGVKSLESFIDLIGAQVSSFSTRSLIVNPDNNTNQLLESYVSLYSKYPIGGIILIDKNGIVTHIANREGTRETGIDLSEREYFINLKENLSTEFNVSKPVISKVGASKDKYTIAISAPIIKNSEFTGVVSVSVILSELVDEYLSPLKLTDSTIVGLLGSGSVLYCSSSEHKININYSDLDTSKDSEWKIITSEGLLVAVSSFEIRNGNTWFVAVGTPLKNALEFIDPFAKIDFIFLLAGIIIVVIFSILLVNIYGKFRRK